MQAGHGLGCAVARQVDAAGFGQALESGGDIDAVAVDPRPVVNDVSRVDADAEQHAAILRDAGIALRHGLLHPHRAFDRPHGAWELGQEPVPGGVDDLAAELPNHRQHDSLMPFDLMDRCGLVLHMSRE